METNKAIIKIEKEPVYIDGVLHYKRTLKKNDKIICEDTVTEESEKTITPKINTFEKWVNCLENKKDGKNIEDAESMQSMDETSSL